jgi:Immunity protein Imm1
MGESGGRGDDSTLPWTLLDWDRELTVTASWAQLEQALLSLPQTAFTPNTIANLVSPAQDTLSIGIAGLNDADNPSLAQPLACVNFTDRTNNPPYLSIVNGERSTHDSTDIIVFRYEQGTWTEIPARNCVPVEVMLRVAKHFFVNGTLPDWVGWEEV